MSAQPDDNCYVAHLELAMNSEYTAQNAPLTPKSRNGRGAWGGERETLLITEGSHLQPPPCPHPLSHWPPG